MLLVQNEGLSSEEQTYQYEERNAQMGSRNDTNGLQDPPQGTTNEKQEVH
jgi:hypothetical protein